MTDVFFGVFVFEAVFLAFGRVFFAADAFVLAVFRGLADPFTFFEAALFTVDLAVFAAAVFFLEAVRAAVFLAAADRAEVLTELVFVGRFLVLAAAAASFCLVAGRFLDTGRPAAEPVFFALFAEVFGRGGEAVEPFFSAGACFI